MAAELHFQKGSMMLDPQPAAILLDLDGVFYNDTRPIPGSAQAIQHLRSRGLPFRFVTNTTSKGREALARKLNGFGIKADMRDIFCPPFAASKFLRDKNASAALFVADAARVEFEGVREEAAQPDYVILGDLGDAWTYAQLNAALRFLLDGARLMALGMSRYWRADDGPRLDVGPMAAALAHATGQPPIVLGKPAPDFFRLVAIDLGVAPEQCLMVGDDIVTDIGGAQAAGMRGLLVRTGKFRPADLDGRVKPDMILDSIADLPNYL
jgi:phospholysine phosphohistidine inorganic pyrophosphate phosphatase